MTQWRKANQTQAAGTEKSKATELFQSAGLQNVRTYPIPNYASSSENPEKLRNLSLVPTSNA